MTPPPSVLVSRRLDIPPIPGLPHAPLLLEAVSVSDTTLMASVARIVTGEEIISRILIADTQAGPARWMQMQPLQVRASNIKSSLVLTDSSLFHSHRHEYKTNG